MRLHGALGRQALPPPDRAQDRPVLGEDRLGVDAGRRSWPRATAAAPRGSSPSARAAGRCRTPRRGSGGSGCRPCSTARCRADGPKPPSIAYLQARGDPLVGVDRRAAGDRDLERQPGRRATPSIEIVCAASISAIDSEGCGSCPRWGVRATKMPPVRPRPTRIRCAADSSRSASRMVGRLTPNSSRQLLLGPDPLAGLQLLLLEPDAHLRRDLLARAESREWHSSLASRASRVPSTCSGMPTAIAEKCQTFCSSVRAVSHRAHRARPRRSTSCAASS